MKYSYFTHPNSVCMNYFKHMNFSMSLSKDFAIASYQAFIHAILPNYYITSSTDLSKDLIKKLKSSGCDKNNIS